MAPDSWLRITRIALVAVAGEALVGFSLCFSPGWANGWPFGLTIYVVWSGGMAFLASALILTVSVGAGAAVGFVCNRRGIGLRYGGAFFGIWLALMAGLAFLVGFWAFQGLHESALKMWPNGYPNRAG